MRERAHANLLRMGREFCSEEEESPRLSLGLSLELLCPFRCALRALETFFFPERFGVRDLRTRSVSLRLDCGKPILADGARFFGDLCEV